mmetsp:Transcript_16229/g.44563  ORF Transcript_16229/g.44563 Transcript_16229/m.44563 type:complete len:411 (-) Transcript_16229:1208-2440(-)
MRRSRGSTGAAKPASRRKSESQKSGLTPSLMTALQRDVYEDEAIATRNRRALDQDEESDSVEGEKLDGTDEEITSDEDDNVLDKPATRQREDDSISFGSSVEADDVMDISHMLSDGESESLDGEGGPTMCSHDDEANSGMLQAIGLRANRSLRARERTEGVEESELSLPHAAQVSIQELLGPLGEGVMVEQLRRDLQNVSKAGARRSVHAQLAAPIEQAAKRRLERQAAAEEAHREVSGWEQAVHQQATAETLSFPQGRQDVHGTTLGSITSSGAKNALENDVDKLLEEHMMDERAAAEAELDALRDRDRNSRLTPAEVPRLAPQPAFASLYATAFPHSQRLRLESTFVWVGSWGPGVLTANIAAARPNLYHHSTPRSGGGAHGGDEEDARAALLPRGQSKTYRQDQVTC